MVAGRRDSLLHTQTHCRSTSGEGMITTPRAGGKFRRRSISGGDVSDVAGLRRRVPAASRVLQHLRLTLPPRLADNELQCNLAPHNPSRPRCCCASRCWPQPPPVLRTRRSQPGSPCQAGGLFGCSSICRRTTATRPKATPARVAARRGCARSAPQSGKSRYSTAWARSSGSTATRLGPPPPRHRNRSVALVPRLNPIFRHNCKRCSQPT